MEETPAVGQTEVWAFYQTSARQVTPDELGLRMCHERVEPRALFVRRLPHVTPTCSQLCVTIMGSKSSPATAKLRSSCRETLNNCFQYSDN